MNGFILKMAAVYQLDFVLMYFIFLGTCNCVQGHMKQYSVCEGKDAKFKFDRAPDNNTLVAEWFKIADNNVNRTCILKKHKIASPCIPYLRRASLSPTDNRLTIARIDRSETGLYLQELDNVNNGEDRYKSYLQVTVLVPPSGLPHINATKSSDGKLILTCYKPAFKGIPEVFTQFQDSNDKPQKGLVVTVADSMYKCCLLGDDVQCMDQHNDVCSIYIVKDIEKDMCISCWILIYVSGVIPWFSLLVKPLYLQLKYNGTSNETPGVNTDQNIRIRCKRQYEQMYKTIMMLIPNLAIVIISSVYFCRKTDDCISVSLLVTLTGFGTSVLIVRLMVIIKNASENKRIQKDIFNKLLEKTVKSSDERKPAMQTTESSGAWKTGTLGAAEEECLEDVFEVNSLLASLVNSNRREIQPPEPSETQNGEKTHFLGVAHGQDKMTTLVPTEEDCLEDVFEGSLLANLVNSNRREIQPPEPSMKTEESSGARKKGTSDVERLGLNSSGGIHVSETENEDRTHVHGQEKMKMTTLVPTQESSGAVTAPTEVDLQIGKKEVNDETNEAEPFQDDKGILDLRQNFNRVTGRVTN